MTVARFRVLADAEPATVPRLVNCVAQLGLVPRAVQAETVDGAVSLFIEQPGLDARQAAVIAEKMRASVLVRSVQLNCDET